MRAVLFEKTRLRLLSINNHDFTKLPTIFFLQKKYPIANKKDLWKTAFIKNNLWCENLLKKKCFFRNDTCRVESIFLIFTREGVRNQLLVVSSAKNRRKTRKMALAKESDLDVKTRRGIYDPFIT